MRVAVIGAGCSGITAIKNLLQAGIQDVVCFEQNSDVGGNWIYSPEESHSSVCETTHIISSKSMSEYLDFPMPADYPDYPSHQQLLAYFRSYARHFGLYPYIRFQTRIVNAEKLPDQRWLLTPDNGAPEEFDFLFVSNGHHSVPQHPDLPGAFAGNYLHAHSYKTNQPFQNQRVLVIGAGNSACDCAVEISRVAAHVAISIRTPQYIIPKFFLGRPTDTFNAAMSWLPSWMAEPVRQLVLWLQVGRFEEYGLEKPDFPTVKAHPTLNSELLYRIRHGKVHPRRAIAGVEGATVTFSDGLKEDFDTIVAATGYKMVFPFFDKHLISYEEATRIPLYLRMFHPEHPTLVFIGLFQPQGAIWPLSDYQAKLAANYVMGRWAMPSNIQALAERDADYIQRAFLPSKRHAIEVHYHRFLRQLQRQIPKNAPAWDEKKRTTSSTTV